ncbi:flavin reductase family protein [Algiphilus aromaticivorans]|uniref:flavin reductase family protein n=1 Tax=Algiphilus aromaticivorans TaxID=382454 RepID=UPI0005C23A3B|nr:flavin reductase family protein [Algiphilus aromaticivorans]
MTASANDSRSLRDALGSFATGVTIITTRADGDRSLGVAAASFNTVSIEPPMVLWSVPRAATSASCFEGATHWAVHILASDQEAMARHFAGNGSNDFSAFRVEAGSGGAPLLPGCATRLQCRTAFRYTGGDHLIFVGEVLAFESHERSPLLFHDGRYTLALQNGDADTPNEARAEWSANNLGYLLGRAYFQLYAHIQPHAQRNGLDDAHYFALAVLILRDGRTLDAINAVFAYSGIETSPAQMQALCARDLLRASGRGASARYHLTESGRQLTLRIVAAAEAAERDALADMSEADATALRHLLHRFVRRTRPVRPHHNRIAATGSSEALG